MANLSDVKNTPVALLLPSLALGSSYVKAEFSIARHRINSDDGAVNAGKKRGAVRVVKDADGVNTPRLYIAQGRDPEDKWNVTDDTLSSITPIYDTANPAPVVGVGTDIKPDYRNSDGQDGDIIASLPFPVVLQSDLTDLGNVVNYTEFSGKKEGTVVIVDFTSFLGYAIATGSEPTDTWIVHNATVLTPTGTARPPSSGEASDFKPTVSDITSINSVDFPVVDEVDLSDPDFTPLYNEENGILGIDKHVVVMKDTSANKLHLMFALTDAGQVFTWFDLGGAIANVPVV